MPSYQLPDGYGRLGRVGVNRWNRGVGLAGIACIVIDLAGQHTDVLPGGHVGQHALFDNHLRLEKARVGTPQRDESVVPPEAPTAPVKVDIPPRRGRLHHNDMSLADFVQRDLGAFERPAADLGAGAADNQQERGGEARTRGPVDPSWTRRSRTWCSHAAMIADREAAGASNHHIEQPAARPVLPEDVANFSRLVGRGSVKADAGLRRRDLDVAEIGVEILRWLRPRRFCPFESVDGPDARRLGRDLRTPLVLRLKEVGEGHGPRRRAERIDPRGLGGGGLEMADLTDGHTGGRCDRDAGRCMCLRSENEPGSADKRGIARAAVCTRRLGVAWGQHAGVA